MAASVDFKNAAPDTIYEVFLVQTPSGADCLTLDGFLTTNANGNGNANVNEPLLPGTTDAFVYLRPQTGGNFFVTPDVTFS